VFIQDLRVNNLLDKVCFYNSQGDSDYHLRRSQGSHNATRHYEKVYSRGFSATGEKVDGEQKEGDVYACDPTQSAAMHDVGHNAP
jgi:hypothetical protein